MIVSHAHKFIFFAVPKTATHTIRQALTPHMRGEDWEQQVLFGQKAAPIPEVAAIKHGHISVLQIRPHLSEQQWQSYFKFAFVRNPFDRYVSTCFFLHRNTPGFAQGAIPFMKQAILRPGFRQRILVRPQSSFLLDKMARIGIDYVGRYETLQQSFDHICEQIGLPKTDLGKKNTSKHKAFTEYYDEQLGRRVAEFYQSDFDNFGYSPDLSS